MAEAGFSRTYTLGVILSVILICLIGLFHLWRLIFRQIKKRNMPEVIPIEIKTIKNGERRISSATCTKFYSQPSVHQKPSMKSSIKTSSKSSKKVRTPGKSGRRKLSVVQLENDETKRFFAGYSHRYSNENH